MGESMRGSVLWFNKVRGYGFIRPEDGSKDIFVHHTGINSIKKFKVLEELQVVEFEFSANDKGRTAVNVSVVAEQPIVAVAK